MGKRYAMVIDLHTCVGCYACQVACKSENKVPNGVYRSWIEEREEGNTPKLPTPVGLDYAFTVPIHRV